MTIKLGGGGAAFPFPTLPDPLNDEGRVFTAANVIPHKGTLIDNIVLPTAFSTGATGDISGRLNESVIWTVNATDINAAADGFVCVGAFWYDHTTDRLYVFAGDTATTPDTIYTAYITLETGAVTNIGSATLSTDPGISTAQGCAIHRATVSSGNFTMYFAGRTVVLNESTGAEVSNVASVNVQSGVAVGTYASADGALLSARHFAAADAFAITRGGNSVNVPAPGTLIGSGVSAFFLPWGDKVKAYSPSTTAVNLLRTFNRAAFDLFLNDVADFGGLA